ncbi:MAG: ABC transporter ATP-binding protein [Deltaproteobacteria bacterium RBG_19FT_COMBO_46_12]|jgi:branched-chain amino acid transport system ATP-binding protein|nr:MAG: ABC transporter ATP-binding protein [Deltaproteobacteria bacterium RBG_19FT_COMBO_46_12]
MLQITNLETRYGEIRALQEISIQVESHEVVAALGANGAGKTTLLNTISGILRPSKGSIKFLGEEITKMPSHKIVQLGIVHIEEGQGIFTRMTVQENLEMGAFLQPTNAKIEQRIDEIYRRFPALKPRSKKPAGTLSGGERQQLAIGRALMASPKLLMMDEPSMGLAPLIVSQIFKIVQELQTQGITVLLVEQNVRKTLQVSDRAYVLRLGKIVHEGTGQSLINDTLLQETYLGGR